MGPGWQPYQLLPWLVAFGMSLAPAWLDLEYREVPESFWVTGSKVGLLASLLTYLRVYPVGVLLAFYGLSLLGAGIVGLASLLGFMGEGDFWAALAIAVTIPAPLPGSPIPPIYFVLLVASTSELLARVVLSLRVCGSVSCLRGAQVECAYLLSSLRWWFPVGSDVRSSVPSEASVRACQGGKNKVVAEPGLPYVTFILLALPVALALELAFRVT